MTKFVYGNTEEISHGDITCETQEEAVSEAIRELAKEVGETFYLGTARAYRCKLDAAQILENLGEEASNEIGDAADDWPDFSKEEAEELDKDLNIVFSAWLDKYKNHPRFYHIDNYQPIVVTKEMHDKSLGI